SPICTCTPESCCRNRKPIRQPASSKTAFERFHPIWRKPSSELRLVTPLRSVITNPVSIRPAIGSRIESARTNSLASIAPKLLPDQEHPENTRICRGARRGEGRGANLGQGACLYTSYGPGEGPVTEDGPNLPGNSAPGLLRVDARNCSGGS